MQARLPGRAATTRAVPVPPPNRASARHCGAPARPASSTTSCRPPEARHEGRTRHHALPRCATRAATGHRQLFPGRRRAGDRAVRRCRPRAASAGAGRRPGSPRLPRASAAARYLRGGPGSRGVSRVARSRPRPPNTGCWRALVAWRRPRSQPAPVDRSRSRAGSNPIRGRQARPNRYPRRARAVDRRTAGRRLGHQRSPRPRRPRR